MKKICFPLPSLDERLKATRWTLATSLWDHEHLMVGKQKLFSPGEMERRIVGLSLLPSDFPGLVVSPFHHPSATCSQRDLRRPSGPVNTNFKLASHSSHTKIQPCDGVLGFLRPSPGLYRAFIFMLATGQLCSIYSEPSSLRLPLPPATLPDTSSSPQNIGSMLKCFLLSVHSLCIY